MNNPPDSNEAPKFWENFLRAVGADPRHPRPIKGASGQYHEFLAIGIDDILQRLIVISNEYDARIAALVQNDVRLVVEGYKVITVRPAAVSMPKVIRALQAIFGTTILTSEHLETLSHDKGIMEDFSKQALDYLGAFPKYIRISALPQVLELTKQLAKLNLSKDDFKTESGKTDFKIDLGALLTYDPIAADRQLGICPMPLYDFPKGDIKSVSASKSPEEVVPILKQRDIYQYFFPAPDSLAVGVIDHGVKVPWKITQHVESAPVLGHPFGEMELVQQKDTSPLAIIDALRERKLVVEGELGLELTPYLPQ